MIENTNKDNNDASFFENAYILSLVFLNSHLKEKVIGQSNHWQKLDQFKLLITHDEFLSFLITFVY